MDAVKLGSFLKQLRKEHDMTQEQLAEKLGVTNRTVSRWETGINIPDIDALIDLSKLYQVDIKELLTGERKMDETKANTNAEPEDVNIVRYTAEYSAVKEKHMMRRIFSVAVAGVVAVGGLFCTTIGFFNDVTGSSFILLSLLVAFLIYIVTMQAFRECRSIIGYLLSLTGGFTSIIVSNVIILCLFYGSGAYHNYGLLGFFYILLIVTITFLATAIITKILINRKTRKG